MALLEAARTAPKEILPFPRLVLQGWQLRSVEGLHATIDAEATESCSPAHATQGDGEANITHLNPLSLTRLLTHRGDFRIARRGVTSSARWPCSP